MSGEEGLKRLKQVLSIVDQYAPKEGLGGKVEFSREHPVSYKIRIQFPRRETFQQIESASV